jgi:hypothetical protein
MHDWIVSLAAWPKQSDSDNWEQHVDSIRGFIGSGLGSAVCFAASALGVYLLVTHTGHLLSALPYLLLFACPLLHFFGHRHGHAHRRDHAYPDVISRTETATAAQLVGAPQEPVRTLTKDVRSLAKPERNLRNLRK